MASGETVQALAEKLKELETRLAQQTEANAVPGQITVRVPKEKKLRKFVGARDDHLLEEWITDAERAISGQSEADAVDFLIYHLDGAAKDEVKLRPAEKREDPAAVFKILRESFCEGLTGTQALRKFFERKQKDRETVGDFSHALLVLLARVEWLDEAAVSGKDKLLRDQSLENVRDSQLRRDMKRWVRDHPTKTFQEIRDEVQRWIDEDELSGSKSMRVREVTASGGQQTAHVKGMTASKPLSASWSLDRELWPKAYKNNKSCWQTTLNSSDARWRSSKKQSRNLSRWLRINGVSQGALVVEVKATTCGTA